MKSLKEILSEELNYHQKFFVDSGIDGGQYSGESRLTDFSDHIFDQKNTSDISNKIVNIDSIAFQNYPKTDKMNTSYGLSNANTTQKQELDQLKTRLDQISQQLADNTKARILGSKQNNEYRKSNNKTKVRAQESINNLFKSRKN